MGTLLDARDIHKTYRLGRVSVPVLRGASIRVDEGEVVAILGKSGSGKSTMMHILGGLDTPDRDAGSSVEFEGHTLARFDERELDRYRARRVGFVFQFYHLLPELSVVDNTLLPAMAARGRLGYARERSALRARAEELLTGFGLGDRLRHRPVELSGGERQRVAIARALINEPRLLLADEPTGNLDEQTGSAILDSLLEHRARAGCAMLIVTHDARVAARADRVVRLRDGVVVDEHEMQSQPQPDPGNAHADERAV
ncbi:MAG: ABC transporter ATP-binding protein [Planctomycetota bacterium]